MWNSGILARTRLGGARARLALVACLLLFVLATACDAAAPSAAPAADEASVQTALEAIKYKDYGVALRLLGPAAKSGNAEARYELGLLHAEGHGTPKNITEAIRLWRLAAEQGYPLAEYILGGTALLEEDAAGMMPAAEALGWVRKAALQGNMNAIALLSLLYKNDDRFRNPAEAERWSRELAKREAVREELLAKNRELGVRIETSLKSATAKLQASVDEITAWRVAQAPMVRQLEQLRRQRREQMRALNRTAMQRDLAELDLEGDYDLEASDSAYAQARVSLRTTVARIVALEETGLELLAARLPDGTKVRLRPDGRYAVVRSGSSNGGPPRVQEEMLPTHAEAALLEFERAWSGLEDTRAGVAASVESLRALTGSFTCDLKVGDRVLASRRSTTMDSEISVGRQGMLRYRYRLGDRQQGSWREQQNFVPLGRVRAVELSAVREGQCSTIYLRCANNLSCATGTDGEGRVQAMPALPIDFADRESAERAQVMLDELRRGYPAFL